MVSEPSALMAFPTSSQTSQSMVASQAAVHTFSNPVALKLDEENYLPWRQQPKATIEGHDLLNHIKGERIPRKLASKANQENGAVNTDYQH